MAFVALAAAIAYNAIFLQKGRHPAPITTEVGKAAPASAKSASQAPPAQRKSTGQEARAGASETVRAVQRELAAKGYDPGAIDGDAGLLTRAAILAYQHDKNLPVTGTASTELLQHIVLGGSSGESGRPAGAATVPPETTALIKGIQQILAELGYAPGPVDGVMGVGTRQAIEAFEREHSMTVTGRVSGKLLRELMRVTGVKPLASSSG